VRRTIAIGAKYFGEKKLSTAETVQDLGRGEKEKSDDWKKEVRGNGEKTGAQGGARQQRNIKNRKGLADVALTDLMARVAFTHAL